MGLLHIDPPTLPLIQGDTRDECSQGPIEGTDPRLPVDTEAADGAGVPSLADVLRVCAGIHRQERCLARPVAYDVAPFPLPSLGQRGLRSTAVHLR